MDLRRLRAGEWIVAISGIVLIAALFLPWWQLAAPSLPGPEQRLGFDVPFGETVSVSGWEAMSAVDVLLLALGGLALVVVGVVARSGAAGPGVAAEALLTPFALVMLIVGLVRVSSVPDDLVPSASSGIDVTIGLGAILGLAAMLGVFAGLLVAMRDERLSRPGRLTDSTGAPVSEPAAVETLATPPSA